MPLILKLERGCDGLSTLMCVHVTYARTPGFSMDLGMLIASARDAVPTRVV